MNHAPRHLHSLMTGSVTRRRTRPVTRWAARAIALLLILGQTACVGTGAGVVSQVTTASTAITAFTTQQACEPMAQTTLPLAEWTRHYIAPATLNGKSVNLVVDTGAQITSVTPELDAALRLPINLTKPYRSISIGGRVGAIKYKNTLASLRMGTVEWLNTAVGVDQILNDRQRADPASPGGLLGADILSGYDVEIDFPARAMTLYRIQGCQGAFAPWQGRYAIYSSGHMIDRRIFVVPVTVNGRPLRAMLDTGSMSTVISRNAALSAGVTTTALASDRVITGLKSAGSTYDAHLHTFDAIDVGNTRFGNATVQVVDSPLPGVEMLLGMDLLKNQRIWLSYGTGQVFMQRADIPVPTLASGAR